MARLIDRGALSRAAPPGIEDRFQTKGNTRFEVPEQQVLGRKPKGKPRRPGALEQADALEDKNG